MTRRDYYGETSSRWRLIASRWWEIKASFETQLTLKATWYWLAHLENFKTSGWTLRSNFQSFIDEPNKKNHWSNINDSINQPTCPLHASSTQPRIKRQTRPSRRWMSWVSALNCPSSQCPTVKKCKRNPKQRHTTSTKKSLTESSMLAAIFFTTCVVLLLFQLTQMCCVCVFIFYFGQSCIALLSRFHLQPWI